MRHVVYVKVPERGDPDVSSREITLGVLKFIQGNMPTFSKMGLEIKVNKITTTALKDVRLRNAMRGRGIAKLPALLTPNGVYLGRASIEALYTENIKKFKAFPTAVDSKEPLSQEDGLSSYYGNEMSVEAMQEDDEEEGIGRGDSLMKQYQHALAARDRTRPRTTGPDRLAALKPKERARPVDEYKTPRTPALTRPAEERDEEPSEDDSDIQDLIRRMSQSPAEKSRLGPFPAAAGTVSTAKRRGAPPRTGTWSPRTGPTWRAPPDRVS